MCCFISLWEDIDFCVPFGVVIYTWVVVVTYEFIGILWMNVQCCQLKAYTTSTNSYLQVLARQSMARNLISTLVDPVFGQSVAEFLYVHELVLAWNLCKDLRDNFSSDIVTINGVIETWLQLQRIRQFSVFTCNHAQCKPRGKWHRSIMPCYDAHGFPCTKIVWYRRAPTPESGDASYSSSSDWSC